MPFYLELILTIFFLGGVISLGFTYLGFPLVLKILNFFVYSPNREDIVSDLDLFPKIQIILSCYNEADIIEKSIFNKFEQNYPSEKLSILVISDGSTDGSNMIVRNMSEKNPKVRLFTIEVNSGKNNALRIACESGELTGHLLCFTDVDTIFEQGCLASASKYFSNPKVGLVAGKISYWLGSGSANQAEGAFWRLENCIREAEGNLGWLVSCPGQFILMRRELLEPLPAEANTDFAMPLMVLAQGYSTKFDKKAVVRSLFPTSQAEVLKRRQRTVIRALSTISIYRKRLAWHLRQVLFWHKTVRFYIFPIQLLILAVNILSLAIFQTRFWGILLGLQFSFYALAFLGWLSERISVKLPLVHLPYQFTVQNAAVFGAVISYLRGKRVSKWTPPR